MRSVSFSQATFHFRFEWILRSESAFERIQIGYDKMELMSNTNLDRFAKRHFGRRITFMDTRRRVPDECTGLLIPSVNGNCARRLWPFNRVYRQFPPNPAGVRCI